MEALGGHVQSSDMKNTLFWNVPLAPLVWRSIDLDIGRLGSKPMTQGFTVYVWEVTHTIRKTTWIFLFKSFIYSLLVFGRHNPCVNSIHTLLQS